MKGKTFSAGTVAGDSQVAGRGIDPAGAVDLPPVKSMGRAGCECVARARESATGSKCYNANG